MFENAKLKTTKGAPNAIHLRYSAANPIVFALAPHDVRIGLLKMMKTAPIRSPVKMPA